jgi:tRNA A-37 threonylcarbamoyl transferase component Bud32
MKTLLLSLLTTTVFAQFDVQLSPSASEQLRIFRTNTLKLILNTTFKQGEQKAIAYRQLQTYVRKAAAPILSQLTFENNFIEEVASRGLNLSSFDFKTNMLLEEAPSWTLDTEVEYLLKSVNDWPETGITDELRGKLEKVLTHGLETFELPLEYETFSFTSNKEISNIVLSLFDENPSQNQIDEAIKRFEDVFDDFIKKIQNVGDVIASSPDIKLPNKHMEVFVSKLFDFYYEYQDISIMKNIISDVLSLKSKPDQMEMAKIMFRNAPPAFGKSIQQFSKKMGESLNEVMSVLDSDGKSVPNYMVEELLAKDKGGYKILFFSPKSHTGTVAQTHWSLFLLDPNNEIPQSEYLELKQQLQSVIKEKYSPEDFFDKTKRDATQKEIVEIAKQLNPRLKNNLTESAQRFLKPGVIERSEIDLKVLEKVMQLISELPELADANLPDFKKMMQTIRRFLEQDFALLETIERQLLAETLYEQLSTVMWGNTEYKLKFVVPEVYPGVSKQTNLHMQEFIYGFSKFSKVAEQNPELILPLAERIIELWYSEALFKSGFFHGDLHQGNFGIIIDKENKLVQVAIFDYGMGDVITEPERAAFMKIVLGDALGSNKAIAKGLLNLFSKGEAPYTVQQLTKIIKDVKKNRPATGLPPIKGPQWIGWFISQGHDIPGNLGIFGRGADMVNNMAISLGRKDAIKKVLLDLVKRAALRKDGMKLPIGMGDIVQTLVYKAEAICNLNFLP